MFCDRSEKMMLRMAEVGRRRSLAADAGEKKRNPTQLRNEAQLNCVALRSLVDSILFFWSLLDSMLPPHRPRDSSVIVFSVQGHRIIDRCLPSLTRNSGWRRPPWPCFYPHSEWARCKLGFDLYPGPSRS